MIKAWTTVVCWQRGIAQLRCDQRAGCQGCGSKDLCGAGVLDRQGTDRHILVRSNQPLVPGQRVEVGISEGSLLRSAMLVYLLPLVGLLGCAAFAQGLFHTDLAAACGGAAGVGGGMWLARVLARRIAVRREYQPVIVQTALPPSSLSFAWKDKD
ncbi:SoxR-reducing system protein RseC [Martelella alba]|uniref:SoxR-reducing system protein RseC n=1 Tax=Martelella alba TaxID=2590451 RepID=A0ABY2SLX7_9HYPH|nr:SoxR-reducing system protein RseC [Martelella alba]TKI06779.1 SoxR-reducing system protein RseC [Martelella alba]